MRRVVPLSYILIIFSSKHRTGNHAMLPRDKNFSIKLLRAPTASQGISRISWHQDPMERALLWELLVTEGHVRSARFRFLAVPLVCIGIFLIWFSAPIMGLEFEPGPAPDIYDLANSSYASQADAPVLQVFQGIQPLNTLTTDQINSLPPSSQLQQVAQDIEQGLNSHDQAPTNLPIKDIPEAQFWAFNWPLTSISRLVVAPDLQIFGAVVTPAAQTSSYPAVRWLAIFRKIGGTWHEADIAYPDANPSDDLFYSPSSSGGITQDQIPVTLRRAMNLGTFTP
jgi:hypothetical protein